MFVLIVGPNGPYCVKLRGAAGAHKMQFYIVIYKRWTAFGWLGFGGGGGVLEGLSDMRNRLSDMHRHRTAAVTQFPQPAIYIYIQVARVPKLIQSVKEGNTFD